MEYQLRLVRDRETLLLAFHFSLYQDFPNSEKNMHSYLSLMLLVYIYLNLLNILLILIVSAMCFFFF